MIRAATSDEVHASAEPIKGRAALGAHPAIADRKPRQHLSGSTGPGRSQRCLLTTLICVIAVAAGVAAGAARAATSAVTVQDELGVFPLLHANAGVVREEGQIPHRWKLALDGVGKAQILVSMQSGQFTFGGRNRTVVFTWIAALLDSPALPYPERTHSTSNVDGVPLDAYLLSWSVSDPDFAQWLSTGTGFADIARYVPGLRFSLGQGPSGDFAFTDPLPSLSPFDLSAMVTASPIPVSPDQLNLWRETPKGSTLIATSTPANHRYGLIERWTLTTDPGSPLGLMIGGRTAGLHLSTDINPGPRVLAPHTSGQERLPRVRGGDRHIPQGDRRPGINRKFTTDASENRWASASASRHRRKVSGGHRPKELSTSPPPSVPLDYRSECARYVSEGVDPAICAHDLAITVAATAKYRDINVAKADGFAPLTSCEQASTRGLDGSTGAMGVHYARIDRMVLPHLDPAAPQMLTYLPSGTGWRLGAAEYEETAFFGGEPPFGGLPAWGQAPPSNANSVSPSPAMFGGKKFDGPMAGHSPIQPWHYDLHVWVGIPNPAGLFAQYNPTASC